MRIRIDEEYTDGGYLDSRPHKVKLFGFIEIVYLRMLFPHSKPKQKGTFYRPEYYVRIWRFEYDSACGSRGWHRMLFLNKKDVAGNYSQHSLQIFALGINSGTGVVYWLRLFGFTLRHWYYGYKPKKET